MEVRRSDLDGGFTMIEVIVSMVIFGLVALVVAGLIINTMRLTTSNTQRTVAANLAAAQIEAVRDTRTLDIPDGQTVLPAQTVGGTTYTLTQTADYVVGGAATSACSGTGDRLSYKLITVVATWPEMGSVQPVRSDTLRSLGIGVDALDSTRGTLAVAVQGSTGAAQADVPVTVSPGGTVRTTGIGGCALFVGLDPVVTYTVTVNKAGYVGIDGAQQVVTTNAGIQAGKIARVVVNYQEKGALAVTLQPPTGFLPPTTLAMTVSNNLFTPTQERAFRDCAGLATAPQSCVAGDPRTAAALYPGSYGTWAGTCTDAKPGPPLVLTAVQPGLTAAVTVGLGGVPIHVQKISGIPVAGQPVYAVHAASAGCPAGESWALPPTGASDLLAALPQGTWTLSLSPTVPATSGTVVTIPAAGVVTAPAVVLAP